MKLRIFFSFSFASGSHFCATGINWIWGSIWLMTLSLKEGTQSSVHVVVSFSTSSSFFSSTSSSSSSSPSLDENGQERFLHQGRCRTHCPRGLYPDRGHYACLPCIANCELCTDGNICAKCRERYKLQNGVCQTASCDIGKREQPNKARCEFVRTADGIDLTGFFFSFFCWLPASRTGAGSWYGRVH